eukprot:3954249-Alexandrium_andersonii.AAC.1
MVGWVGCGRRPLVRSPQVFCPCAASPLAPLLSLSLLLACLLGLRYWAWGRGWRGPGVGVVAAEREAAESEAWPLRQPLRPPIPRRR